MLLNSRPSAANSSLPSAGTSTEKSPEPRRAGGGEQAVDLRLEGARGGEREGEGADEEGDEDEGDAERAVARSSSASLAVVEQHAGRRARRARSRRIERCGPGTPCVVDRPPRRAREPVGRRERRASPPSTSSPWLTTHVDARRPPAPARCTPRAVIVESSIRRASAAPSVICRRARAPPRPSSPTSIGASPSRARSRARCAVPRSTSAPRRRSQRSRSPSRIAAAIASSCANVCATAAAFSCALVRQRAGRASRAGSSRASFAASSALRTMRIPTIPTAITGRTTSRRKKNVSRLRKLTCILGPAYACGTVADEPGYHPLAVARWIPASAPQSRGAIAQLGERLDRTQEVGGSSPPSSIASVSAPLAGSGAFLVLGPIPLEAPGELRGNISCSRAPARGPDGVLCGESRLVVELVDHVPVATQRQPGVVTELAPRRTTVHCTPNSRDSSDLSTA